MRWHLQFVREPAPAKAGGLSVVQQCAARVYYHDVVVRDDFVDLRVEDALPVELKTVKALDDAHRMPCANDLKATGPQRCPLVDFAKPRLETKRLAHGRCTARTHLRASACIACLHLR